MSDYVATSDIPFGDPGRGVYAFRKGDRVPADMVKDNDWKDYVAGAGTQAAQQAISDVTGVQVDSRSATTAKSSKEG